MSCYPHIDGSPGFACGPLTLSFHQEQQQAFRRLDEHLRQGRAERKVQRMARRTSRKCDALLNR